MDVPSCRGDDADGRGDARLSVLLSAGLCLTSRCSSVELGAMEEEGSAVDLWSLRANMALQAHVHKTSNRRLFMKYLL